MNIIERKTPITLCEDPLPFDYSEVPDFTAQDYEERIDRLLEMAARRGLERLVVYGDREHSNNLCYLTGLDPRFEEALLILEAGKTPVFILGNECMGYSQMIPLQVERVLYQNFSLMGQPRDGSARLSEILAQAGIRPGKTGVIGWKSYDPADFDLPYSVLDLPSYLVDLLASLAGRENLENAVDLLASNEYGLKHCLSAKEIVHFEAMGTKASRKVYRAIRDLKPGMSEIEASGLLEMDGEPTSIHPNINFGDANASYGLRSPTYHQTLAVGDIAGIGIGYRGFLIHKQGFYVHNAQELPAEKRDAVETFVKPYFGAVAAWYESLAIGEPFSKAYDAVDGTIGLRAFGIGLNPGHLTHMDEWTNSPFQKGNSCPMRSGMGIQCDFTATHQDPFYSTHVEDGLVLADAALRQEIAALSPACWARIEARRTFMKEVLNIQIADEVLPLSDLPAVCFPYMADTSVLLAKA